MTGDVLRDIASVLLGGVVAALLAVWLVDPRYARPAALAGMGVVGAAYGVLRIRMRPVPDNDHRRHRYRHSAWLVKAFLILAAGFDARVVFIESVVFQG